ncbi:Holliday junction resolvase RuvX [bacterium]|nr:Holliday junction resolvase RuvX [bacterium]
MAKILAIDWGEKKSGLAISDKEARFSFAYALLPSVGLEKEIKKIVKLEEISTVVLGRPRNMDGSLGSQAEKVFKFAEILSKEVNIPIKYEDETGTSSLVKSQMIKEGLHPEKNKDLIDKRAAQLILEGYLNEQNN